MATRKGVGNSSLLSSTELALQEGAKVAEAKKASDQDELKTSNNPLQAQQQRLRTKLKVDDPLVTVTIKVPKSLRRHWSLSATLIDSNVKEQVILCMTKRFGKPADE